MRYEENHRRQTHSRIVENASYVCAKRPELDGSDLNFAGWAKKVTGVPTISVGSVGLTGEFIATLSRCCRAAAETVAV